MEEIKKTIQCIHRIYYKGDFLNDPVVAMDLHRHMGELFNFAGIEETLLENNPGELSSEEFLEIARPRQKERE